MSTVLRPERSPTLVNAAGVTPGTVFDLPTQRAVEDVVAVARCKDTIAWAGRLAAVALPAVALGHPHRSDVAAALGLTLLVVACWWIALRLVFNTNLRTFGAATAAAAGSAVGFVFASTFALWLPALDLDALTLVEAAVLIFLFTTGWETLVQKRLARRQKVLVLGGVGVASDLAAEANSDIDGKFDVVGLVADEADAHLTVPPLLGTLADLGEVVEAHQPDLIVLADADPGPAVDQLLEGSWRKFRVVGVSHFFEHAFGRVPLAHISPAWFMSILHLRQPSYDGRSKRAFDLTVALVGLVLAAPILVMVALAVRLSGRPVLFKQTRLGEGGRKFQMYKFRTMIPSGEPDGRARWAEELDPRVTGVGRFLRRTRLDELPQLWNVLRGEMSMVGPRPERPEFMRVLEEKVPYWNRRLLVKPGVTGWAQIRSGYAADQDATIQKLSYDLWYLRHRTLLLDVLICARTLVTVISGAGAR